MAKFTEEEQKILSNYVTDVGGDIFAIKNLSGLTGAVYARYSRAKTGFQETLLKEFIEQGMISHEKAEALIERVLIAYGDDSVGELEGAHVSFENISILATKEIEDRRIGGSPIEKSTRYVFFDEKDEMGSYKYIREPKIMASAHASKYVETLDYIFDTYKSLIEPMQQFYQELFPLEKAEYDVLGTGEKQKLNDLSEEKDQKAFRTTYKIDLKTKACDTLRCLLPLATKTNVGMFGNGRFYQLLISHLISTPYPEVVEMGNKLSSELKKIIPKYVHRAQEKKYTMAIDKEMKKMVEELARAFPPLTKGRLGGVATDLTNSTAATTPDPSLERRGNETVYLVPFGERNSEEYLIANMLYAYVECSFGELFELVKTFDRSMRDRIKATYVGKRETRRDRPGRALESGYTYTFDLFADYGTYKDLMRHRTNTQMRQIFSPRHGFVIPQDLQDAGFSEKVLECHAKILELYEILRTDLGEVASYVVLHGHRVRWLMGMNDRAAMHMLELRTTKQGHPQYRKLCQEIHSAIKKVDPWRAEIMQFVDHNSYDSARGDSEARQRVKERMLEEKNKD